MGVVAVGSPPGSYQLLGAAASANSSASGSAVDPDGDTFTTIEWDSGDGYTIGPISKIGPIWKLKS
ncbi:MAG: hypothetical protein IPM39_22145 [Chloroflexi bacterium]|nr:hypothetical protein [Chloroflexota bacterium]